MHIPDGYIAPSVYTVSYLVATPLWIKGFSILKSKLDEETLPLIASLSALSFIIMMFNIPIPGGTSGHVIGVGLISILFGPWIAFLSISLVLFIQAILFGDGGITTFAINALSMGFVGAFSSYYAYKSVKSKYNIFLAGYVGAVASSILVAFLLGIEPLIATDSSGKPLYFPFGLETTFYALVGSHLVFFGVIEGIFTNFAYKFLAKLEPEKIATLEEK